jgi:hypothetical protein
MKANVLVVVVEKPEGVGNDTTLKQVASGVPIEQTKMAQYAENIANQFGMTTASVKAEGVAVDKIKMITIELKPR